MCRGRLRRDVLVLLFALTSVVVPSGRAAAHTELDFTLPAQGTTVGEPVREISIGFTAAVRLVGNGFEVLDPQGNVVYPFAVTDDDMIFRLQLDPPLAGGAVAVRYEVASLDGHILEGSFTFTAAAEPPPPTTTSTVPLTTPSTAPASVLSSTTVTSEAPTTSAAVTIAAGEIASSLPSTTANASSQSSHDDSERTVLAVVLLAVALGAAGFLLVRSRRSCRW